MAVGERVGWFVGVEVVGIAVGLCVGALEAVGWRVGAIVGFAVGQV